VTAFEPAPPGTLLTAPAGQRRRGRSFTRAATSILVLALVLAACGDDADTAAPVDDGAPELVVSPASFDLAVGDSQRLMAGLFTPARQLVGFGSVEFELAHLGDGDITSAPVEQRATARFLPVPGMEPAGEQDGPVLLEDTGSGVYAARVDFDRPGVWGLRVVAAFADGTVLRGSTRFMVQAEPAVPAPGDPAPRVTNPTLDDVEAGRLPAVALDSRAQDEDQPIPDEHLHTTVIADAIDAGRPVVVTVGTPVYCQSRFCGPLTDVMAGLAEEYGDRAEFVLLEVWRDFEAREVNEAAGAFIQTELGGNEPWVFLIDANGTIAARWDNILDVAELRAALAHLPAHPPVGS